MSRTFRADNGRYEFPRNVYQDGLIYSHTLAGATPTCVTAHTSTLLVNDNPLSATGDRIEFKTLVGNIPDAGVVTIGTEQIRYASVNFLTATTGYLNRCIRGFNGTVAAIHAQNTAVSFLNDSQFSFLSYVVVHNNTRADIFVAGNANIYGGGNAVVVAPDTLGYGYGMWVDHSQQLWVLSAGGGDITVELYA